MAAAGDRPLFENELRRSLAHISRLSYRNSQFMIVDAATQLNLEPGHLRGRGANSQMGRGDTSPAAGSNRHTDGSPQGADWIVPSADRAPAKAAGDDRRTARCAVCWAKFAKRCVPSVISNEQSGADATGGNVCDLLVLRTSLEQIPSLGPSMNSRGTCNLSTCKG